MPYGTNSQKLNIIDFSDCGMGPYLGVIQEQKNG